MFIYCRTYAHRYNLYISIYPYYYSPAATAAASSASARSRLRNNFICATAVVSSRASSSGRAVSGLVRISPHASRTLERVRASRACA